MTAPRIIGPYEIVDLLGRGGMGEVYKAVDVRMYRRPVALKLLSEAMGADARASSRFDLEVETAANLRHPNIVQIYDRGEHEGRRYFAMEFLEGVDLGAAIKARGSRSLDARLELVLQLCDALDYAHAQGVVHRDIKPANIMVLSGGGSEHVKLLDFGIAHVSRSDHTKTTIQPGTLLYMSPEQLKDEPVSPASDLFSLGIVTYELCAGVHPFKARTEYLASSNIMFEKHPPLRTHEPSAPEELERLLDRLLEKDPEQRPQSAGQVADELRKIVRQMRAAAEPDAPSFGNLDEMTGPMVERIVHWARSKESEGAVLEALEAYKRALLLAPGADWLETRVATLTERLREAPAADSDAAAAEADAGGTTSRARQRREFVEERMAAASAALDDGDLDRASSIAAAVLRRYPDEEAALSLIDRVVLITDRGVPVKAYRREIRAAREALAGGDIPGARRSCEAATEIWPDDDEVITLGREIEKVRQVELAKALKSSDDLLARLAGGRDDDGPPPPALAEARAVLEQALRLGADEGSIARRRETLDGIEAGALARRAERESRDRAAEEARRSEIASRLDEARRGIEAAESAHPADVPSAESALASARSAAAAAERARALGAEPAAVEKVLAAAAEVSRSLTERIATLAARERERSALLAAVATGLADVEASLEGPAEELPRIGGLLRSLGEDLDRAAGPGPERPELRDLRSRSRALGLRLASRRAAEDERVAREQKERREREEALRRAREAAERSEREEAEARRRAEAERRSREEAERASRVEAERAQREESERRKREKAEAKARVRGEAKAAPRSGLRKWGALAGGAVALAAVAAGIVYGLSGHKAPPVPPSTSPAASPGPPAAATTPPPVAPPAVPSPPAGRTPPPPEARAPDFTARVDEARRDLREAGNAPMRPAESVQSAIDVAERGIAACRSVLAEDRGQAEAKSLLAQLEKTRDVLARRKAALETAPPAIPVASAPLPPAAKPPAAPPVVPAAPAPVATPKDAAQALIAEAQRQPLTSRDGLERRIETDRQALGKLGPLSGEGWAKEAARGVQRDLDSAAVWDLFYRYKDAVERRDPAAIAAVWPTYPKASAENLKRAKAFEFSFTDLRIEADSKAVVIRQTTRQKMDANYWENPITATVRYVLDKRPDGSYAIRSAAAER